MKNKLFNFAVKCAPTVAAVAFFLIAVFIGCGAGRAVNGPYAFDMGGQGQACYPNSSCDIGLTCFRVRGSNVCEKQIRPVHLQSEKFCYSFRDTSGEQSPCFKTNRDCVASFSRLLQTTKSEVISGCGYETDFTSP